MQLDLIVQTLLDEKSDQYSRALTLYEFQTALFYPNAFSALLSGKDSFKIKKLRHARLLAATKILERVAAGAPSQAKERLDIATLAANKTYARIYDNNIVPAGNLSALLELPSAKSVDKYLRKRRKKALDVAKLIDFSYRISKHHAELNKKPTKGAAVRVVMNAKSYKCSIHESSFKTRWDSYGQASIFLYLVLIQKQKLQPPAIRKPEFIENLLEQARDITTLRKFFASYQEVRALLPGQAYNSLPQLRLQFDRGELLATEPLPDDAITEFKK